MTLNPPSFRLPFNLPEDLDPEVRRALEFTFNGLTNHEQAFRELKQGSKVTNNTTIVRSGGGGGGSSPGIGGVNNQLGQLFYTTQQSDNGVKIIVGDSSPVTVTMNGGVTTPWLTFIDNDSSSTATLTPSGAGLMGEGTIPPHGFGVIFYDGAFFWSGSIKIATASTLGYVQPDNVTIKVDSSGVISTSGSFTGNYVAVSSTYAVQPLDYQIECTSGTFTVTLPTAVGIKGRVYSIKNSGNGTITVATTSGQLIDGSLTQPMTQYDNLPVMSNGTGWLII